MEDISIIQESNSNSSNSNYGSGSNNDNVVDIKQPLVYVMDSEDGTQQYPVTFSEYISYTEGIKFPVPLGWREASERYKAFSKLNFKPPRDETNPLFTKTTYLCVSIAIFNPKQFGAYVAKKDNEVTQTSIKFESEATKACGYDAHHWDITQKDVEGDGTLNIEVCEFTASNWLYSVKLTTKTRQSGLFKKILDNVVLIPIDTLKHVVLSPLTFSAVYRSTEGDITRDKDLMVTVYNPTSDCDWYHTKSETIVAKCKTSHIDIEGLTLYYDLTYYKGTFKENLDNIVNSQKAEYDLVIRDPAEMLICNQFPYMEMWRERFGEIETAELYTIRNGVEHAHIFLAFGGLSIFFSMTTKEGQMNRHFPLFKLYVTSIRFEEIPDTKGDIPLHLSAFSIHYNVEQCYSVKVPTVLEYYGDVCNKEIMLFTDHTSTFILETLVRDIPQDEKEKGHVREEDYSNSIRLKVLKLKPLGEPVAEPDAFRGIEFIDKHASRFGRFKATTIKVMTSREYTYHMQLFPSRDTSVDKDAFQQTIKTGILNQEKKVQFTLVTNKKSQERNYMYTDLIFNSLRLLSETNDPTLF